MEQPASETRTHDRHNSSTPWSFPRSEDLLEEALRLIPLGSQTFSKSVTQYPREVSPFFIESAKGSRCTDIDGHEYVDFVNALLCVTLGHCDPDVTQAVEDQLKRGTIFSLPSPLEVDVARLIVEMVPCAESVRFGKNGSDATAGAIRAARAFTGRDHVAVCGYHGWQDWYIASTARNKGIPETTRTLTHTFPFNDASALSALLESRPGEFAAVILEPMNVAEPLPGFLSAVLDLAHDHGALCIFDETITGFRFSNGGAQELFGVTPDLACFGKGIANGYPLSAVAGKADIMKEFENVFFSFTMGGEALSLAAAKVTLEKLRSEPVIDTIAATGRRITEGVRKLIQKHDCGDFLSVTGHPSWTFLVMADTPNASSYEIKTLWMQEIMGRGLLCLGTHNVSLAHSNEDIDHLFDVYDQVFPILKRAVDGGGVGPYLRTEPLEPLFKVR